MFRKLRQIAAKFRGHHQGLLRLAGISVMPFGCEPIYSHSLSLAIFFASVSFPKPRACTAEPPPCHAYPAGSGKASILSSMLLNRRRVRWLSAKRNGQNQVCLGNTTERRGEESAASALPEAAANVCLEKFSLK